MVRISGGRAAINVVTYPGQKNPDGTTAEPFTTPPADPTANSLNAQVFAKLLLAWLTNVYDELIGLRRSESEATWTRRLCAPPEAARAHRSVELTSVEGVVVINVYVAVVTLMLWYVSSLL